MLELQLRAISKKQHGDVAVRFGESLLKAVVLATKRGCTTHVTVIASVQISQRTVLPCTLYTSRVLGSKYVKRSALPLNLVYLSPGIAQHDVCNCRQIVCVGGSRSIDRSVGRSVGQSVGRSPSRSVGRSVGRTTWYQIPGIIDHFRHRAHDATCRTKAEAALPLHPRVYLQRLGDMISHHQSLQYLFRNSGLGKFRPPHDMIYY